MNGLAPVTLSDNRVPVYYAGGATISRFRGLPERDGPEDWVGSTTALASATRAPDASPDIGVSRDSDGTSLRDLIASAPDQWLGPDLAAAFGGQTGLLVKLLDAGERLPVHCHPSRDFARKHLSSVFGKTEGWVVLSARPQATIWIGMRNGIDRADLKSWIASGNTDAMLAAMNEVRVAAGQVVYVPSGLPHSIGPGIMLAELQEPTSFSVLADYTAFGVDEQAATLGLGWDLALSCFDLGAYSNKLHQLMPSPTTVAASGDASIERLFADEAVPYFQALRVRCHGSSISLPEPSFAILIVAAGEGRVSWGDDTMPIRAGQTILVPWSAGQLRFAGEVECLVCLPPAL